MNVLSEDAWKYDDEDPRKYLFPKEWDNEPVPNKWQSILLPKNKE